MKYGPGWKEQKHQTHTGTHVRTCACTNADTHARTHAVNLIQNLGFDIFPDPVGHFGLRCCRRCIVAVGERVSLAPQMIIDEYQKLGFSLFDPYWAIKVICIVILQYFGVEYNEDKSSSASRNYFLPENVISCPKKLLFPP